MAVTFTVILDDGFEHLTETGYGELGPFPTFEHALEVAKGAVDEHLRGAYSPGMKWNQLYSAYAALGLEVHVISSDPADTSNFHAWPYARARCKEMCPE